MHFKNSKCVPHQGCTRAKTMHFPGYQDFTGVHFPTPLNHPLMKPTTLLQSHMANVPIPESVVSKSKESTLPLVVPGRLQVL